MKRLNTANKSQTSIKSKQICITLLMIMGIMQNAQSYGQESSISALNRSSRVVEVVSADDPRLQNSCMAAIRRTQCDFQGYAMNQLKGECSTRIFFKNQSGDTQTENFVVPITRRSDVSVDIDNHLVWPALWLSAGLSEAARMAFLKSNMQQQLINQVASNVQAVKEFAELRGIEACEKFRDDQNLAPEIEDQVTYWE